MIYDKIKILLIFPFLIAILMIGCSGDASGDEGHPPEKAQAQATGEDQPNLKIWLKETVTKTSHINVFRYCGTEEECGRIAFGDGVVTGIDLESTCWAEAKTGQDLPDSCSVFR